MQTNKPICPKIDNNTIILDRHTYARFKELKPRYHTRGTDSDFVSILLSESRYK